MPTLFKQSLQSLGFKLIGFAAQGVKCDFHNSPSKGKVGFVLSSDSIITEKIPGVKGEEGMEKKGGA